MKTLFYTDLQDFENSFCEHKASSDIFMRYLKERDDLTIKYWTEALKLPKDKRLELFKSVFNEPEFKSIQGFHQIKLVS